MPVETRQRQRLSVEARREQLLELGRQEFTERPYEQVAIEEVAARGGVSVGLLYHYFGSKHGFYVAVVEAADLRMRAATEVTADEGTDRLHDAIRGYLEHVRDHREEYVAIVRGAGSADPAIASVIESTRALSVRRILDEFGIETPEPEVFCALQGWLSFLEEVAMRWTAEADDRRLGLDDVVALCHKMADAAMASVGLIEPRVLSTGSARARRLDETLSEIA